MPGFWGRVRTGFFCAGMMGVFGLTVPATLGDNLDWEQFVGGRKAPLNLPGAGGIGFTSLGPERTGVTFTNRLTDALAARNRILENGSGVALGDIDGDGWVDIYLCSLTGPNRLYRNLGNWRFEDITSRAGVACAGQYSTGAVFADVNGNGNLDLLVNSIGGGTRFFLNDGTGKFKEVYDSGLVRRYGGASLALADLDGDGFLDLYAVNYRTTTYKDRPPGLNVEAKLVNGEIVVTPPGRFLPLTPQAGGVTLIELGEADLIYRNTGAGRFSLIPWTQGNFLDEAGRALQEAPLGWGLSAMFRDMQGNGLPDLYVCNDFFHSRDRVWMNQGTGRFQAIDPLALRNMSMSSMAVDFGDLNRNGHDDFLVVDMLSRDHQKRHTQRGNQVQWQMDLPISDPYYRPEYPRNTLFLNRGDGTYAEIAQLSGLEATEWSWSVVFLDVDLDGYEDVLITTGHFHDVIDMDSLQEIARPRPDGTMRSHAEALRTFPRLELPNLIYRNEGDLTFRDMEGEWGFDTLGISHGMALADLDNDGDLDLVVNHLNQAAGIYRNNSLGPRVAVRLKGPAPNTQGIGAKIRLHGGAVEMQAQEVISGGRYLSGDDPMRVFAAGGLENVMRLEVEWRNGKKSVIEGVKANHLYEIDEAAAQQHKSHDSPRSQKSAAPMFEDASHLLKHQHVDESFDDFARQPLLPHRLSQLGPGVAWQDVDGDGWDDLIITGGRGGEMAVFLNNGQGGFAPWKPGLLSGNISRDQTTPLLFRSETERKLLVGTSNYEDGSITAPSVEIYSLESEVIANSLPGARSTTGPLALGDFFGDGTLELFVGGRTVPGRHPEPASSRIFRWVDGSFEPDQAGNEVLENIGLVSGAVFSDLTGNGIAELILACEWGPVRIFANRGGTMTEITADLGLDRYVGWWNGVTTGDFDGDGRLDIVASNWGRNTPYERHREQPLKLYYGDLNGNGRIDLVEAYFDSGLNKIVPVPALDRIAQTLPFLRQRFPTHASYAATGVEDIFDLSRTRKLEATWLETTVFLNRGDHFEARPLPVEAQFAPAFGVSVGDVDGDGHEDILLTQNFFAVQPETSRYDGGRGLWLRGDGQGNFQPVPGQESGIQVYGEQRGGALSDFDGDGRVDWVVTQHNGPTRLYRNVGGNPGLRVRLKGSSKNPDGIGSSLRLHYADDVKGPVRHVHGGSGYGSQESVVQVLGKSGEPTQVWVRWPGGKETVVNIPPGAREIEVVQQL
jgi:enediyne biosynthesis protein E4